ncbi:MAG UNVERIFIED_CONTAM: helix-turn-helix domain-containing protein [Microcystis novacekii LVE1205-3]
MVGMTRVSITRLINEFRATRSDFSCGRTYYCFTFC